MCGRNGRIRRSTVRASTALLTATYMLENGRMVPTSILSSRKDPKAPNEGNQQVLLHIHGP